MSAKDLLRLHVDPYDAWAGVMAAWFDVAGFLYLRGETVPPAWHYRPGPMGPAIGNDPLSADLAQMDTPELVHLGNVLDRWSRRLRFQGRDY